MNQKLVKKIRPIAFSNNPSSVERRDRKWVVLEDQKQHRMLRCLDPRATYKMIKSNFKNLPEKGKMRKEIYSLCAQVKKQFPKGIVLSDKRRFLGQDLPEPGGTNETPR